MENRPSPCRSSVRVRQTDEASRERYGVDGLNRGHLADVVVLPGTTAESRGDRAVLQRDADAARAARRRAPATPAAPCRCSGGVVVSLERLNRILEIDEANLLAVVEPNVITGDLQDAVERVGLFYPPDPASLRQSAIGGNVAESAGGPRAFKYGVTGQYVLGLEAVLPTGEIIRTGGKMVKNVVGYDLTHLLVGSEGHARDHHARSSAAHPEAASAGDAPRDVSDCRRGGRRGPADRARTRRAGRARAGRRGVAGGGLEVSGRRSRSRRLAPRRCC